MGNFPTGNRFDDIFFVGDKYGWACRGNGEIYNTTDGGNTWNLQVDLNLYLRSIEFIDQDKGFCGSLDSGFFKTTDGGANWVDISTNLQQKIPGVCGLSIPDSNTIFGVGVWTGPAYLIKSTDAGNTWTHTNMSAWAHKLIDVHFINADTGFVIGAANPDTLGALILYTEDGGMSWVPKHYTNYPMENAWKIQSPDGKNMYVSLEFGPTSPPVRILKSSDYGNSWHDIPVDTGFQYIQMVGFIDSLHGWTGGNGEIYETTDGGISWSLQTFSFAYNRFFKISDSVAFLTSRTIHRYGPAYVSKLDQKPSLSFKNHGLKISPNPADKDLTIDVKLIRSGFANLEVWTRDGKFFKLLNNEWLNTETKSFDVSLEGLTPGVIYVVLKTNEGNIIKKVIHSKG